MEGQRSSPLPAKDCCSWKSKSVNTAVIIREKSDTERGKDMSLVVTEEDQILLFIIPDNTVRINFRFSMIPLLLEYELNAPFPVLSSYTEHRAPLFENTLYTRLQKISKRNVLIFFTVMCINCSCEALKRWSATRLAEE